MNKQWRYRGRNQKRKIVPEVGEVTREGNPMITRTGEVDPGSSHAEIGKLGFLVAGTWKSDPSAQVGKAIQDALDPTKAPSKVQTLATMSDEKRAEMERLYGRKK